MLKINGRTFGSLQIILPAIFEWCNFITEFDHHDRLESDAGRNKSREGPLDWLLREAQQPFEATLSSQEEVSRA